MTSDTTSDRVLKNGFAIIASFAFAKLFIHLAVNYFGGYGIFRDELYYVACSNHLDIGYVDQPPLSLYLLACIRLFFGDSVFAIRFLSAVAGAATLFMTGRIVQEFGGKAFAQCIACLASLVSLINLGMDSIYSMNAFDLLFGTLASYITVRLINTGHKKYWLFLGAVCGLGALNKIGMLWFGAGIAVGILCTSHRVWFKSRWPWIAALVAFLLFLPFVLWNILHDFAHLEFIRNATLGKYSGLSLWTFSTGQILIQNPVTLPVWISGLAYLLISKDGKRYLPLGIAFLFSFAVLAVNAHSKSEYLASTYSVLFAGGGMMFEGWFSHPGFGWLRAASVSLLSIGLFLAPLVLPVLPVEGYILYAGALGITPSSAEAKSLAELPQFYADMFGWEDKASAVARVYHLLTPQDQVKCALYADNYGRCAAIDYYGRKYDLPPSVGPHNNYWIWGPREYSGEVVIMLGGDLEHNLQCYESVWIADSVSTRYCMPYENHLMIYLCRNLKEPVKDLWPKIKRFE